MIPDVAFLWVAAGIYAIAALTLFIDIRKKKVNLYSLVMYFVAIALFLTFAQYELIASVILSLAAVSIIHLPIRLEWPRAEKVIFLLLSILMPALIIASFLYNANHLFVAHALAFLSALVTSLYMMASTAKSPVQVKKTALKIAGLILMTAIFAHITYLIP